MYLSNPAKSFLITIPIFISTLGCGFVGSGSNNAPRVIETPASSIPFKTKEPESFQCEILEKAGDVVRRKRLAKKGNWRRIDFDLGEPAHRAVLQTDKEYVIDIGRRIYAETAQQAPSQDQFSDLTRELLNTGQRAEFEEIGREGTIIRYTVRLSDSGSSEIVVHFDESVGLPVKQEFFSTIGGERRLGFIVEIVNFRTHPDLGLFSVPAEYKRVSVNEILAER
jgi:hypothetical protein